MMMAWQVFDPIFESDELDIQLNVTPWSTNRRFAYDLVRNIQPRTIVELGSHYGCSLFCFAQAVKDGKLDTKISGIDTWEGDEQAGFYGEEILNLVKKIKQERFPEIPVQLIRKRFKQALSDFEDETIDLIHIDGLHTYAAVKEDFETWLPKLAPNGIMLFHDITGEAKKKHYGSVRHWDEVSQKYPNAHLNHNWGLGILFPKGDEHLQTLSNGKVLNFTKLYEIATMQELLKNRRNLDLAWQEKQTNKWWQSAMDYRYELKLLKAAPKDTPNRGLKGIIHKLKG